MVGFEILFISFAAALVGGWALLLGLTQSELLPSPVLIGFGLACFSATAVANLSFGFPLIGLAALVVVFVAVAFGHEKVFPQSEQD